MKILALIAVICALALLATGCNTIKTASPSAPEQTAPKETEPAVEKTTEATTQELTQDSTEESTENTAEDTTEVQTSTEQTTTAPLVQAQGYADVESWPVFVVNENYPLPENYEIETVAISQFAVIDKRCASYALDMINAAKADGIQLNVTSGYRSVEKQRENIEFYIENYMSHGYTYEEAERLTYSEVAKPGCSEHNAGLAMDIVTMDWFMFHTELTRDFQYTKEFGWLQENSWKYGFIMSFPEGKAHITGFDYEPWHYRFVGVELAKKIIESGEITLNEYLEKYQ